MPAALTLAACGPSQSSSPSAAATAQGAASGAAAQSRDYHAELALVGQPELAADGKSIIVRVNITNDGPIPFGTQATAVHNVNLGAHSIDAAGKIMDNDLARGSMPQAAPGATVKATVSLPIDKMLGNRAELLPVAEGVGWFDKWGTKPLVVGPFMACSDASFGRICDAAGIPLTLAQQ